MGKRHAVDVEQTFDTTCGNPGSVRIVGDKRIRDDFVGESRFKVVLHEAVGMMDREAKTRMRKDAIKRMGNHCSVAGRNLFMIGIPHAVGTLPDWCRSL